MDDSSVEAVKVKYDGAGCISADNIVLKLPKPFLGANLELS